MKRHEPTVFFFKSQISSTEAILLESGFFKPYTYLKFFKITNISIMLRIAHGFFLDFKTCGSSLSRAN